MRRTLAALFLLMATTSFATAATPLKVSGGVTWQATGKPGFLKIDGEGGKVTGTLNVDGDMVTGTLEVALKDFVTGIELRDEHMRDRYLQVATYPTARLVVTPTKLGSATSINGVLTIKGTSKPAVGACAVKEVSGAYEASCNLSVKLSDYPVGVPSHLGVTVAELVDVAVTLKASP